MQRTITRVLKTPTGCIVEWRGETKIDLYIPKREAAPSVGDVIVFKTDPSAGVLMPDYTIKKRRGGYVG